MMLSIYTKVPYILYRYSYLGGSTLRKTYFMIIGLVTFILSGCINLDAQVDKIEVAELTERENAIISNFADEHLAFDYSVDEKYEEITVWIEKYEFGQLVDDKVGELSSSIHETGSIIFSSVEDHNERDQKTFALQILQENGTTSMTNIIDSSFEYKDMMKVWGGLPESTVLDHEEMVIGTIGYSKGEFGISSFTNTFYEDFEAHQDQLKDYDVAYLLKISFK